MDAPGAKSCPKKMKVINGAAARFCFENSMLCENFINSGVVVYMPIYLFSGTFFLLLWIFWYAVEVLGKYLIRQRQKQENNNTTVNQSFHFVWLFLYVYVQN